MKMRSIMYTLLLLCVFSSEIVFADRENLSESSSAFTDHYGVVDAVYAKKSRLVISDLNLHYTFGSSFYKESGARMSNLGNELKSGTPVKFSFFKNSSGNLVIKKLKIVSEREFRKSQKSDRD